MIPPSTPTINFYLGISAFYHDSAAALLDSNGKVLYAISEERITRKKGDKSFPFFSVLECIEYLKQLIDVSMVEVVVGYYERPFSKFHRILSSPLYFGLHPRSVFGIIKSIKSSWGFSNRLVASVEDVLLALGPNYSNIVIRQRVEFCSHHLSHALSSFHSSAFSEALCITCDGVGEWDCSSFYYINEHHVRKIWSRPYPHSLGLLYATATAYLGFKVNSGEYKLMGLSPYGEPKFLDLLQENLLIKSHISNFRLNLKYFNFSGSGSLYTKAFIDLLPIQPLPMGTSDYTQGHLDFAASIQRLLELKLQELFDYSRTLLGGNSNLCYSGGVALNCKANQVIFESIFNSNKNITFFINPASGDAGSAIGAGLHAFRRSTIALYRSPALCDRENSNHTRRSDSSSPLFNPYLGRQYTYEQVMSAIAGFSAYLNIIPVDSIDLLAPKLARLLSLGNVVALFQGRDEFGPRALGNRSILASPLGQDTQARVNTKIKFREDFRPFAPVTPIEMYNKYFQGIPNDYMLITSNVKSFKGVSISSSHRGRFSLPAIDSSIPAVTHVDGSARVQTVSRDSNKLLYDILISLDDNHSHPPVLLNTSFNVRGEPIVHSPVDAIECFLDTNIDYLSIEGILLEKTGTFMHRPSSKRFFEPD